MIIRVERLLAGLGAHRSLVCLCVTGLPAAFKRLGKKKQQDAANNRPIDQSARSPWTAAAEAAVAAAVG